MVSNAFADIRRHCSSGSFSKRSVSRASASTSSISTQVPLIPSITAPAGQPVRVASTGVRQATASRAGRFNPSLRLAVSQTSQLA